MTERALQKKGFPAQNFVSKRSSSGGRAWEPEVGESEWPQDAKRSAGARSWSADLGGLGLPPDAERLKALRRKSAVPESEAEETVQKSATPESKTEETVQKSATPESESEETVQKSEAPESEETVQKSATPESESEETVQKSEAPESETEETVQKSATPESETEETVQKSATPESESEETVQKSETPESESEETVQKSATPESESEGTVQKSETPESESEETVQKSETPESIQPKLSIGTRGDKYEQEADSTASKVMAMPDSAIQQPIQRQTEEGTEGAEAVQMQPLANSITPLVQRSSGGEEEDIQMKSGGQQASEGSNGANASLESRLAGSKGGESPLPNEVRSFMEPRFGADFSNVRVHTGSEAVQMNKELGAQAFAHGSDIYYGAGKSPGKNELTAHELTHTVQQGGAVRTKSVMKGDKKDNKLQAKADLSLLPVLQPKIQRKENPQEQPAAVKAAAPSPGAIASAPTAGTTSGGTQVKTAQKPAAGGGNGGPTAPAGGSGAGALSSGAAGGAVGGGGGNSPLAAQSDPGFQAVVNSSKSVATQEKNHPPAGAKSAEAQAAAVSPANEIESQAQDKQVQEMNQQPPGQFNAGAFKAALMARIAAATPQTLEQADNFKDQNKLDAVKGDLSSQVGEEKKQAANPIEEKTKEQPDTSGIAPKPVTPLPPQQTGKAPSDIGAERAAPKPKSESEVSLQEGSKSIDKQMADADVTDEQLAKSNEPQFQTALETKTTAQTNANTAPSAYRQQEQGIVTQAQAQAQTTAQTQLQGMHGEKAQLLTQVLGLQTNTKGQDEQKRSEVASNIQGIYNNTKQKVETLLSQLDGEVNQQFDSGAAAAKTQFENDVAQQMKSYKDERYSGLDGAARWVRDLFLSLPSDVNAFYEKGKIQFLANMSQTIDKIANHVASKLNAAKAEIAKGKQEIQQYVASLDPSLRQVGQEAAQNIQGKFDELGQSVDNKQNELIDSLAQKYNENLQALDARITEMKAANRGLVDKAMDSMGGVIKTILEMKNLLMGVLSKAAGAIDKIIKDPIGFLGNLISGIKQGFQNFAGNIWQHLKKGMLAFLTGALAGAGITMPENFDLKGIFNLVMQVLGVVYEAIKSRVVKALGKNGEKIFRVLETSFEMFVILKNEGIEGLWKFVQDKIGDLKAMVIDSIQTFVVESVIKAGVMWVLSLLNPASAFVRACKAIYDIIMFFIERGSQIAELVSAVTDSVAAIASGAVGGAAKLIENALGTALPVVISFMASLLGLGGISEKIGGIIKKVRSPIDKAIDWLISQAVKFAKKIGGKLGFGKDKKGKDGKPDERTKKEKEADLEKALNKSTQLMRENDATPDTIKAKLPAIQSEYKLTSLELVKTGDTTYHVEGKVNPENKTPDITLSQANEGWEKAWKAKQEEVHNAMQKFVPQFIALDPNAEVKIRGSLATGVKMNPEKRAKNGERYLFNPTDFDIDAYVVSETLYRKGLRLTGQQDAAVRGKIIGSKIPEVRQIIKDMRTVLADIAGNRDTGGQEWKFNVVIRSPRNADFTSRKDKQEVENLGLPPSRGNSLKIKPPAKD
ncbi:DUF4157 domain-containing protein [Oscillatoria sp. FACHB-1406]|uniref:eCIS core domain-containing protein n=1 Tax=Oscillatoria sp. FACHB-1406 TaxID=2692846 RepID=UPI0018F041FD|nr:DUF4157 domain-containing protein [Oscillatoria sp. FACHB-1406]